MNLKTFFENFRHFADTPNDVEKLRELILQLAVSGKLCTQDPKDEPAANLLAKIREEKQNVRKNKKIHKIKRKTPLTDEMPCKLPKQWIWTCLDEAGLVNPGGCADDDLTIGFLSMEHISSRYGQPATFEERQWGQVKIKSTHFAEDDVVLAKITPGFQNGKSAVMRNLPNGIGAGTGELHVFRKLGKTIVPDYVLIYLKSPLFLENGVRKMTGSVGGQRRVGPDYFAFNPFPLPPLAEQKRIVATVDKLMAMCDEMEEQQQKQYEARLHLNNSIIDKLLASQTTKEFTASMRCICDNFSLLYDTPDAVASFRQAILQFAMQGKLCRQDPNDEPASILIEKIRAEKLNCSDYKKKEMSLPISSGEIPYEIPQGWQWVRFSDVVFFQEGHGIRNRQFRNTGIKLLSVKNLVDGKLVLTNTDKYISKEEFEKKYRHFLIQEGDLLFASSGSSWGKTAIFHDPGYHVIVNTSTMRMRFYAVEKDVSFLRIFVDSAVFKRQLTRQLSGTQPNFGPAHLRKVILPLPPLAEQKRIAAKVDQLTGLCDKLQAQLKEVRQISAKLMTAAAANLIVA